MYLGGDSTGEKSSFSLSGDSEMACNAFFIRTYGVALFTLWDMHSWLCSKTSFVPFPPFVPSCSAWSEMGSKTIVPLWNGTSVLFLSSDVNHWES